MDIDALEAGEIVADAVFLVAQASLQVDRRGQNYYNLVLNAEGGRQIDAKVWSDNIGAPIEAGTGLETLARVDEYRGKKQLNVQRYRLLSPQEYDLSAFVRTADVDPDAAFDTLFNWESDDYTNPYLKLLMAEFHGNGSFAEQFKTSPAASFHHHNYSGGLVEHTLDVWTLAERIGGLYPDRLDRDMLLAGAALHDVGKTRSYRLVAGISERTDVAELLDHVFVSASMVSNVWDSAVRPAVEAKRMGEVAQCKALLLHIVLSHHGKMEWGSPVLPKTPEALLIHYCDNISATMHSSFEAIEAIGDGQKWTDKVYIMDQARKLYVTGGALTGDGDAQPE